MIQRVIDNLPAADEVKIALLEEHGDFAGTISYPLISIVWLAGVTGGAACTVLKLLEGIDEADEVIVANCDQYLDWEPDHFLRYARRCQADGAIPIFRARDPKWSYVAMDDAGLIHRVVEKEAISTDATCGVYYWRTAQLCRGSIEMMIAAGTKVNNEYYLAPSYNKLIATGYRIVGYPVAQMFGMGTPEDLQATLDSGVFGASA